MESDGSHSCEIPLAGDVPYTLRNTASVHAQAHRVPPKCSQQQFGGQDLRQLIF